MFHMLSALILRDGILVDCLGTDTNKLKESVFLLHMYASLIHYCYREIPYRNINTSSEIVRKWQGQPEAETEQCAVSGNESCKSHAALASFKVGKARARAAHIGAPKVFTHIPGLVFCSLPSLDIRGCRWGPPGWNGDLLANCKEGQLDMKHDSPTGIELLLSHTGRWSFKPRLVSVFLFSLFITCLPHPSLS